MHATVAIDSIVLCEQVLGWKIATMEGRDDFWTKPGDRGSWAYQNTIEDHTPDFMHNISAAMMLAKAASKKYEKPFRLAYHHEEDGFGFSFMGQPVEAAAKAEAAITRAVWALVQGEGK